MKERTRDMSYVVLVCFHCCLCFSFWSRIISHFVFVASSLVVVGYLTSSLAAYLLVLLKAKAKVSIS